jgi:hypothetical protein
VTDAQALALVREIRALERLAVSIKGQQLVADEWRYALVALDDRLRWLRYAVSLEDPGLVSVAVELEADERRIGQSAPDPVIAELSPRSRTIH